MDIETQEALERVLILARVFVDSNFQVGQENYNAIAKVVSWLAATGTTEADSLPTAPRTCVTSPATGVSSRYQY